jgi:hypothetical protein
LRGARDFHLARSSERSPLHDVRNPARRFRDARSQILPDESRSQRPIRWWSQTGSNRRPPACKAGALPAELWPRSAERCCQLNSRQRLACRAVARGSTRPPSPFGFGAAAFGSLRERRLVGLGRLELPTSRLSSARSNQLSYKPESLRGERPVSRALSGSNTWTRQARRAHPARARPRRKRNGDGGVPPMDIYDRSRSALMFPRDPIEKRERL